MLGLLFKALQFLFGQVVQIFLVDRCWTVGHCRSHGLWVLEIYQGVRNRSDTQSVLALFILADDGVDQCDNVVVGVCRLEHVRKFAEDHRV